MPQNSEILINPEPNYKWTKLLRFEQPDLPTIYSFQLSRSKGVLSKDVARLNDELQRHLSRRSTKRELAVQCLVANLERASHSSGLTGVCLNLRNASTSKIKRYNKYPFNTKLLKEVVKDFEKLGLITVHTGYRGKGYQSGLSTLIFPTEAFKRELDIPASHQLVHIARPKELVVLKTPQGDLCDYSDSLQTKAIRIATSEHNDLRTSYSWNYSHNDKSYSVQPEDLICHRSFKGDWGVGGRFFCKAQHLSKGCRATITINGEPCVEYDYTSMQVRLLYNSVGLPAPHDCYAIDDEDRALVKKVALIAVNSKNRGEAIRSLTFRLKLSSTEANRLLATFEKAHSSVSPYLFSEGWKHLQNAESNITNDILTTMTREAIPTLPIHDSFVVPASRGARLHEAMHESYERTTGFVPVVVSESVA